MAHLTLAKIDKNPNKKHICRSTDSLPWPLGDLWPTFSLQFLMLNNVVWILFRKSALKGQEEPFYLTLALALYSDESSTQKGRALQILVYSCIKHGTKISLNHPNYFQISSDIWLKSSKASHHTKKMTKISTVVCTVHLRHKSKQ